MAPSACGRDRSTVAPARTSASPAAGGGAPLGDTFARREPAVQRVGPVTASRAHQRFVSITRTFCRQDAISGRCPAVLSRVRLQMRGTFITTHLLVAEALGSEPRPGRSSIRGGLGARGRVHPPGTRPSLVTPERTATTRRRRRGTARGTVPRSPPERAIGRVRPRSPARAAPSRSVLVSPGRSPGSWLSVISSPIGFARCRGVRKAP
jgi:hypothetical protein